MSTDEATGSDSSHDRACTLCGRPATDSRTDADGTPFCSPGCRDVVAVYGHETGDTEGSGRADPLGTEDDTAEAGTTRSFFRVDGMSRPTDEAYLASVARGVDGVTDAEASYVTGTVRVDHDPERASTATIADALSTLGYSAVTQSEAEGEAEEDPWGRSRGSDQTVADQVRSVEDVLSVRYVVGIVFGTFLLLPYLVFLYPAYLVPYVGGPLADLYGDTLGAGSLGPILPLFAILAGIVLAFTGLGVLRGGYVSLKLRRVTTDLLVSLTVVAAYLYSVLGMATGRTVVYFDLTVVVAATVTSVALYETTVKRRALDRLTDLTVSQVRHARLESGEDEVPVADLAEGERILVREGERIPVDGTLAEGECTVEEAVVTGESLPILKRAGDPVVGGSLVRSDAAVVEVGDRGSTIDRITTALWSIQSADHGIQRRADRIARRVFPVVVAAGVLGGVAAVATGGGAFAAILTALLAVFVVTPWTLGIASPLSVATSIGRALDRGIVVLDDSVFERLRSVDTVVFDKTGTLTTGEMDVLDSDAPADLLAAAAALERRASHPAAEAIVQAFGLAERESETEPSVSEFQTHATGVEGTVDGETVLVGHPDLFADRDWTVPDSLAARVQAAREDGHLPILLGRNGAAGGVVVVGDEPRSAWESVVEELDARGVSVAVLTGDDSTAAAAFADHPGVDHVFAGVPPAGKAAAIRRIGADREVAMVGDGTNDAPALAAADLGIALETGTALAADAADVALVDDDLSLVTTAFDLAAAAGRRVEQNVALAALYVGITVPLALAGVANPLFVVLGAVASGGALAANSFRRLVT